MSGTKRLIQELRKYGQDPGPISNDNRGYWMRTLQQLKQRPDKGCGQRSPSRRRKDFFSSDDNLDDDDVDNGRKRKRLKNRPTQHRYRDISRLENSEKVAKKKIIRNTTGAAAPAVVAPRMLCYICSCLGIAVIAGYVLLASMQEARIATELRRLDNFLPCSPDSPKEPPCLLESNVEVALDIAYFISEYVSKQAGDYDCLIGGGKSRNVSMKDLKVLFLREGRGKGWTIPNLSHALQLLFANPHWGIRLYLSNGSVVSNSMDADVDEVNFVESLTPLKPWVCRLENALLRLRLQIIYIIVG
jgi:hypothetical protein